MENFDEEFEIEEYDPCSTLDGNEEYRKECTECGDYGFPINLNSRSVFVCTMCCREVLL